MTTLAIMPTLPTLCDCEKHECPMTECLGMDPIAESSKQVWCCIWNPPMITSVSPCAACSSAGSFWTVTDCLQFWVFVDFVGQRNHFCFGFGTDDKLSWKFSLKNQIVRHFYCIDFPFVTRCRSCETKITTCIPQFHLRNCCVCI